VSLSARKNSNYTVSVFDSRSREIRFRDIKGSDLEYLDSMFAEENSEPSFDQVVELLSTLCTRDLDFRSLTQRTIMQIFDIVKEHILCNYMTKIDWLRRCYGVQNGSFAGVSDMEQIPLSKFTVMSQIHLEAIENIKTPT
jgi:hypothetical protein